MPSLVRHVPSFLVLALLCAGTLPGCREEPDSSDERTILIKKPENIPAWLAVNDKSEPAVWLRSREAGHEVLSTDPEVGRLGRVLKQAVSRFYEDERMIANRTAQTADALAESGQPEHAIDILTGMVDAADVSSDRKLYGDMCQHYLILRRGGEDHAQALAHVADAYKHAARCNEQACAGDHQ
jgi:hypothetical protein